MEKPNPVYVYTTEDGVRDGILVKFAGPFPLNVVTRSVWEHFTRPMGSLPAGLGGSPVTDVTRLSRALDAVKARMTPGSDFVEVEHEGRKMWAAPNDTRWQNGRRGWTVMFPEDY